MIRYLRWDSNFFGKKIGKMNLAYNGKLKEMIYDISILKSEKYDCIYIEIPEGNATAIKYLKSKKIFPISIKSVMFIKSKAYDYPNINNITTVLPDTQITRLYNISHQISHASRFYKDVKLRPFAYKLYEKWVHKSCLDSEASECFYLMAYEKLVGLITVKMRKYVPQIDLFGVDKSYRNLGFGTQLLKKTMLWAYQKNYHELTVCTQKENHKAVSVYEKNGFFTKENIYQYHLWN